MPKPGEKCPCKGNLLLGLCSAPGRDRELDISWGRMEKIGEGHPAPRGTAQSLRAEKAFNAPLMALFSSTAFLALSISRQAGPPPKTALQSARSIGACNFICSL